MDIKPFVEDLACGFFFESNHFIAAFNIFYGNSEPYFRWGSTECASFQQLIEASETMQKMVDITREFKSLLKVGNDSSKEHILSVHKYLCNKYNINNG